MSAEGDLSRDAFLDGQIHVFQPKRGYRAGVDPVLLAAATPARSGQTVLELGCGAGVASLCLHARVAGLSLTGIEVQPFYAALAQRNAVENGADMTVCDADLRDLPQDIRARSFDHVIANPPYYERARSTASEDEGRDIALAGETPLATWVDVAARRLAPKGYLTMIQKADRLPELLCALEGRLGSVRVRAVQPRVGRVAELVLVQARKSGRAGFVLEAPLIMHQGLRHERDGESYAENVLKILRSGADLPWSR
ncbi:tRNA1(Val) (adenine(37)-N6)-methyltransferase [Celeribacter halophilus]|uniref:tRNA1(Val) (adenine(37)-N6)-methyltransferase n=1 Tax=Celeribacter halophilus TaxID=576117 RepID=UPI001C07F5D9|nr:methyltransferase [Celeribacter halophilus]MBU2891481.1 methyltransferase [Celeribacter halophilus]MDO6509639.1 methyltransferase [Celeribacter halophilus]